MDLVILPETWRGQNDTSMEAINGETINVLSALARKLRTYIVSPFARRNGDQRLNSAVLLDRSGKVVFIYDKVFPYWSEFDQKKKVDVGTARCRSIKLISGVGLALCFDVNFPELWKSLADQAAELVVWPSA